MSFFRELKRRNVFKVAIAYVVTAWLVMQVADVILNNVEAPAWIFHVILLFLGIGFVFAIFFAWEFELTPEGLKREKEVDRERSITGETGRRLNYAITGMLVLALGYFAYDKFVLSTKREDARVEAAVQAAGERASTEAAGKETIDRSIAVLPFADMSPDKDQEYFSDGLSEELLNLLARVPELSVAARTSSFSFKGQNLEIPEIARRLKVAHVLEGSVRKAGNQLRITAQLIKADDGYHLWSETWDRTMDNVFTIQDEIARAVVDELKVTLLGEAPTARQTDPEAFALMLQGRHHTNMGSPDNLRHAEALLKQALEIDPGFAEAWADLGRVFSNMGFGGLITGEDRFGPAREALNRAIELDPENASAYSRLGWVSVANFDLRDAARLHQRALELEPGSTVVLGNATQFLDVLGKFEESKVIYERLQVLDPANPNTFLNASYPHYYSGDFDRTIELSHMAMQLSPGFWGAEFMVGSCLLMKADFEAAESAFEREQWEEFKIMGAAMASLSLGRPDEFSAALERLETGWGESAPSLVAVVHAWSKNRDAAFEWLQKALVSRDSWLIQFMHDPLLSDLRQDPRWLPFLERAGLDPEQLSAIEFEL